MFPQFGATADTLSKASTLVFRIGTDAHLYDDPEDVNIAPLLDSKFDSEKCEALKRLLALIAQGFDVSNFFPQVVKNVASQSLEVKKLVYLYLLHYAEKRPNEALLSINYFQKDLGDPNPLIRGWALRTMAGIRLHVIAPLVLVAAGKCARDPSVYVRKCAANALPKLYDLRLAEHTSSIEEIVGILLNDHSPGVVGAAAAAFASVCPNNFSLIGQSYQRLCEILPDVEEWGQIVLIGILLRFVVARHGLVRESIMFALHFAESYNSEKDGLAGKISVKEDTGYVSGNDDLGLDGDMTGNNDLELASMVSRCYIEGPDEYLSRLSYPNRGPSVASGVQFTSGRSNIDVKILLQCTSPLLWSNNSAVVLAAAGVHWIMAPREDVKRIVKPLLFLLRSSAASKYVVLCNIQVFAKAMSSLFAQYFEDLFVCSSDSYPIKALKLEILSSIATDSSVSFIFKEFQDYIRDPDRRFAADTVAAIGLCAQRLPKMAKSCMEGLLTLTRQEVLSSDFVSVEGEAGVLIQAIISIKSVIKQDPLSHEKVIIQLIRSLDSIKVPAARAMIIWMVGEYSSLGDTIPRMLTTVLKYIAWHFTSEALETKLQILNSIVKVLLYASGDDSWSLKEVLNYVLELAVCDLNYDVRDRARFLKKILSCSSDPQGLKEEINTLPQNKELSLVLAECIFRGQTTPVSAVSMSYRFYLPGSLSQIVLHAAPGYEPLPKPCSFLYNDLGLSNMRHGTNALDKSRSSESYNTDDPDSLSGSFNEESGSDYSSQRSITGSNVSGGSDDTGSANEGDDSADPLIQISDVGNASNLSQSGSADLGELISKRGLESWLNDQPGVSSTSTSEQRQIYRSSARISIGDIGCRVKSKSYILLDPTNGNGLKVDYTFSSDVSTISQHLVCVEVFFENCSSEPMADIFLVDDESSKGLNSADQMLVTTDSSLTSHTEVPIIVSMEAINSLEPGQTAKRIIQVRFHHHLLPLKLALFCNDKKHPVKLRPDIGYFVKPLPMGIETFTEKESRLPGMFEYVRSCRFTDHIGELNKGKVENLVMKDNFLVICECLALKMLGNANLFLVSVDMPVAANLGDASGLCLRFSSEILSSSIPCLITITVEGKCYDPLNLSIKVNCAETVFGLNLLNRVVNLLAESSPALL